jgi:hypothetical protein
MKELTSKNTTWVVKKFGNLSKRNATSKNARLHVNYGHKPNPSTNAEPMRYSPQSRPDNERV